MTSNLPDKTLLSTIPALPAGALLMSKQELADRIGLLDAGDVGQVEITRWLRAAANGQWTATELLAAVDWLNENHTGYVKVAHVHQRIIALRERWAAVLITCYRHPNAAEVMGCANPDVVERIYNCDPIGWRDHWRERVLATMTRDQWIDWSEARAAQAPR